ncbi:class I SAM-dependent methyltransferase [Mycoplasmatota bacterium]|nr:class I SAM-dependent methyltransferase [Mycoplasmatota bacterium]
MIKRDALTYLDLDECVLKLEKYDYTKDEMITFIKQGKLKGEKIDNKWYVNQCDLRYFTYCIEQPEILKQAVYSGAIGVDLSQLSLNGKILDIGGGGEGIIGQLKSDEVIAIDPLKQELIEAPSGPIKIVMNAKELLFLDHSFETVTSFFTLMYIKNEEHKQVFEEIYRVLKPNGHFILWDVVIPKTINNTLFIAFLEVTLPNKTVSTGYGQKRNDKTQTSDYFIDLGKEVGFQVESVEDINNNAYCLKFTK